MEWETFLHWGHVPGMGLGTGGALRAEQGCAMGCAAHAWDRRTGVPQHGLEIQLAFVLQPCPAEFSAWSGLSMSPRGPVVTQGGDGDSQWSPVTLGEGASAHHGTSQPQPSGASPCSCLALHGDKRANTALSPQPGAGSTEQDRLAGPQVPEDRQVRPQLGTAGRGAHGEHGSRAVPTWDLPMAVAGRNISVVSRMWAVLLTWQLALCGG